MLACSLFLGINKRLPSERHLLLETKMEEMHGLVFDQFLEDFDPHDIQ